MMLSQAFAVVSLPTGPRVGGFVPPLFSGLIREERLPINVEASLLRRWGTFAQENLLLAHSKSTRSASLASLVVEATQSRSPRQSRGCLDVQRLCDQRNRGTVPMHSLVRSRWLDPPSRLTPSLGLVI